MKDTSGLLTGKDIQPGLGKSPSNVLDGCKIRKEIPPLFKM